MTTTADHTFAGNGILRCRACGRPYRDHAIGPCPTLGVDTLTTAAIREDLPPATGACIECGQPARTRANADRPTRYCSDRCRRRHYKAKQR